MCSDAETLFIILLNHHLGQTLHEDSDAYDWTVKMQKEIIQRSECAVRPKIIFPLSRIGAWKIKAVMEFLNNWIPERTKKQDLR